MKRKKLEEALDEISPRHIAEAAAPVKKKKRALTWIGAVAAVLALVLAVRFIEIPMAVPAEAVSIASGSRMVTAPATTAEALETMKPFLAESCAAFLSGEGNQLYSPINAYIGLAMAAELTAGTTRQQLLDALGAPDTETLARYTTALWESAYTDDGNEICTLASSLWLDEGLKFNQSVMDTLAYDYFASVYRQDLQSAQALKDIRAWLNSSTGSLLKDSVQGIRLPEETVLALYSTIYFQSKWGDEFNASGNTEGPFHTPQGDIRCTFMNKKEYQTDYYWGESFGAVALGLKNGSRMWFILPDEGKTPEDVLAEGEYLDLLLGEWENAKYIKVNLSVPKFDVQEEKDLRSGLVDMGITELFNFGQADFSASLEDPASIAAVNQAVRVQIDETGVTAAAYIEMPAPGDAPPPEEIIDFILDRPFLFLIADNSGIPLFAGAVEQPS